MLGDAGMELATSDSGGSSSILKSGYDPTRVKGASKLKTDFSKSLDLDPTQAKVSEIKAAARDHGKYKAMAENVRRLSKEKLGAAEGLNQVYEVVMGHAVEAARHELKWQNTTQKGLEALSPLLLDMGIGQEQHTGYCEYLDVADRALKF